MNILNTNMYLKIYDENNIFDKTVKNTNIFKYELDNFQKWACYKIDQNENILVIAPTSSGKTVPAIYAINKSLLDNKRVIYTSPIKALANQKYNEFCDKFGKNNTGIFTGDVKFNPTANILIVTAEILRNLLYNTSTTQDISLNDVNCVIMDEVHYLNDISRGVVWEETLILLPKDIKCLRNRQVVH